MKICHVTSAHNSNDVRILEKECVSLAKKVNNKVYLVARGNSYEYKNVAVIGIGKIHSSRIGRMLAGARSVFKVALALDADIYHLHDPELLPYAKKFVKHGKKVIFDSHELYYEQIKEKTYIPKWIRSIVAELYRKIEDNACKYLSGAIFPCEIDGKHPFEGRVKNIEFINNVPIVNVDSSSESEGEIKSVVCCIGSLTKERGIVQLVEACKIAEVKLILGGNISEELKEKLINNKEYADVVDYRGFCTREQVDKIYKESSIGVSNILHVGQYPKTTNLPTKVYEYMMYGIPFVFSDSEYNKKISNEYGIGVVINPADSFEIANAIKYLIHNEDIYRKMRIRGLELIENKFNWKLEEAKLYVFYDIVYER